MNYEISGSYYSGSTQVPGEPRIFTRFEKGQALSHAEMDANLTSLFHTASISETSSIKEAQYVTLHYAPQYLIDGSTESITRNPVQFQNTPSADDIRFKLANETVPGNLDVSQSLQVGDNLYVSGTLFVNRVIYERDFDSGFSTSSTFTATADDLEFMQAVQARFPDLIEQVGGQDRVNTKKLLTRIVQSL